MCPFCHRKLESDKIRHHTHVTGEYSNGIEMKHYEDGQYICTCCNKYNLQLSFNKKNYRLSVYFHNGSHYDFIFIMKFIASMDDDNEMICGNHSHHRGQGNTDRIPWYSIQGLVKTDIQSSQIHHGSETRRELGPLCAHQDSFTQVL